MRRARPTSARLLIAAAAASLPTALLVAPAAAAGVIEVGAGESIQAAIAAAQEGDTILVGPGTYVENLDLGSTNLVLRSTAGAAETVVDGGGVGPVVTIDGGQGAATTVQGFTLRNGTTPFSAGYEGGGVHIERSAPTIRDNVITSNEGGSGAGVSVAFGSPTIVGNRIEGNRQTPGTSGGSGGGIAVRGAGAAQLLGNVITGNSADTGGGIDLFAAGTPVVRDNIVTGNTAWSRGAGIALFNDSAADIVQNRISGNTLTSGSGQGGGVYASVPSGSRGPLLRNNTIIGNSGSAVHSIGFTAQTVLTGNVLVSAAGPALTCDTTYSTLTPQLDHNDFWSTGSATPTQGCAGTAGNGNLTADPLLDADFVPTGASPLVDAGGSTGAGLPATDLAGRARVVDGDRDGTAVVDIGAYEGAEPQVATAPGAPTAVSASSVVSKGRATVTVHWQPPSSDGGSPITAYRVTGTPGLSTVTVSADTRAVVFDRLHTKKRYTFTVTATNAAGTGPGSSVTLQP